MFQNKSYLLFLSLSFACDRDGAELIPETNGDFESVIEVGEVGVMSVTQFNEMRNAVLGGANPHEWSDSNTTADGKRPCYFGILGQAEIGVKGGATLTFKGTGDDVCLIVDPETVFWNTAVAATRPDREWRYPDFEEDDGDIDLYAGLSSYYTGSPGLEIGDFKGFYTDSLGNQIEIEYGECTQLDANGTGNAHAGRASVESCTINTYNRVGIEYTMVLESFSIPLDDGALSFGVAAVEGKCTDLGTNECSLYGESLVATRDQNGEVRRNEDGSISTEVRECTRQLELAYCQGTLLEFCCIYPEMCGEDAPDSTCATMVETEDSICSPNSSFNYLCCQ